MTLTAFSDLLPDERPSSPRGKTPVSHFFLKPMKKRPITVDEPCLQHSGLGGDVGVGHMEDITPCADAVPESIAHVPQQIQRFPHYLIGGRLLTEEHQIDV
jgi:hypothetical protein